MKTPMATRKRAKPRFRLSWGRRTATLPEEASEEAHEDEEPRHLVVHREAEGGEEVEVLVEAGEGLHGDDEEARAHGEVHGKPPRRTRAGTIKNPPPPPRTR